jgi:hypothetical protein
VGTHLTRRIVLALLLVSSVSGAQKPEAAPLLPEPVVDDMQDARLRALEERVARDERRIRKLEAEASRFKNLRIEGFVQPQFLLQRFNAAASPNRIGGALPEGIDANDTIARPDGTTTNGTFFRIRRARLRVFYETDVMRFFLQLDGLPQGGIGPGIGTILRQAEATAKIPWTKSVRTEVTAGLFFTPFRKELLEPSVLRPFIERTWFIQNAFPVERDIGVHAKTIALSDRLVVDVAIVNGSRLGERTFVALPDLSRSKDGILYTTYRAGPVTGGASAYVGRGQIVDAERLRYKQFDRWAVNTQLSVEEKLFGQLGPSRVSSELTFGENMDAGVIYPFAVPAIPADVTADVVSFRQRAFYLRLEQDLGRWITVGYRFDTYTPNVSLDNNGRDTHAFLFVGRISPNLRWMNEFGAAFDNVHPVGSPAPAKHIAYLSTVLQAMF